VAEKDGVLSSLARRAKVCPTPAPSTVVDDKHKDRLKNSDSIYQGIPPPPPPSFVADVSISIICQL
jgi:hypothetical protein